MESAARDCDIMMNGKPPNKLISVGIGFVVIDFLDSCDNCANKNTAMSNKSRSRASDSVEFIEEIAPSVYTCPRDTQAVQDKFQVPSKLPEA